MKRFTPGKNYKRTPYAPLAHNHEDPSTKGNHPMNNRRFILYLCTWTIAIALATYFWASCSDSPTQPEEPTVVPAPAFVGTWQQFAEFSVAVPEGKTLKAIKRRRWTFTSEADGQAGTFTLRHITHRVLEGPANWHGRLISEQSGHWNTSNGTDILHALRTQGQALQPIGTDKDRYALHPMPPQGFDLHIVVFVDTMAQINRAVFTRVQ